MPNYQNGKIYMIESLLGNGCVYYGSTVDTLSRRLSKHRSDIKNKPNKNLTSKEVLKYDDARILLIELFPCNSKMELEAQEATYIRNNECVNKCIPQRTQLEYYQDNKETISKQMKKYQQKNKEVIKEKSKKYKKQYQQKNKEKIKEKMAKIFLCHCGKECAQSSYKRHTRSQQHQFWQNTYDFIIS